MLKSLIPARPIGRLLLAAVTTAAIVSTSFAQIASDNGSNYGGGWTDSSNGGTGFGGWGFNNTQGTGSAGLFIGDPGAAGISGMSATSFGFFANPLGSGANAEASRGFNAALGDGQTFSFQWGLNWDSNSADSNRGFILKSGGSQLFNLNMANNANITINGSPMFTEFGTQGFTVNFEQISGTSIRVYGTGRNGIESFNQTYTGLAGRADNFAFYFNAVAPSEDQRQMYVNNLEIVPEPSTYALLGLGAAFGLWQLRRRKQA
jgi:hypothetical protein